MIAQIQQPHPRHVRRTRERRSGGAQTQATADTGAAAVTVVAEDRLRQAWRTARTPSPFRRRGGRLPARPHQASACISVLGCDEGELVRAGSPGSGVAAVTDVHERVISAGDHAALPFAARGRVVDDALPDVGPGLGKRRYLRCSRRLVGSYEPVSRARCADKAAREARADCSTSLGPARGSSAAQSVTTRTTVVNGRSANCSARRSAVLVIASSTSDSLRGQTFNARIPWRPYDSATACVSSSALARCATWRLLRIMR